MHIKFCNLLENIITKLIVQVSKFMNIFLAYLLPINDMCTWRKKHAHHGLMDVNMPTISL
jgi:hypothetical protein